MTTAGMALILALAPLSQEEKKGDLKQLSDEAAQALRKAAKPGGYDFTGTLKTEVNPDEADSEPTECQVSGSAASPFQAMMVVKSDASKHEIVYQKGKMAGRLTWKGHPLDLGKAPGEILSLVNLERLAIYAEKATAAKALPDAKVGEEDCRLLELVLPKETLRSHSDDAESAEEEEKSVEKVELKLHLRKSDGLPVKLEATVYRLYKDEENPADTSKGRSEYSLSFKGFGPPKVKIPPALEKLYKE